MFFFFFLSFFSFSFLFNFFFLFSFFLFLFLLFFYSFSFSFSFSFLWPLWSADGRSRLWPLRHLPNRHCFSCLKGFVFGSVKFLLFLLIVWVFFFCCSFTVLLLSVCVCWWCVWKEREGGREGGREGWGPKGGGETVGGTRRVGEPKFRASYLPLPPPTSLFLLSLDVFFHRVVAAVCPCGYVLDGPASAGLHIRVDLVLTVLLARALTVPPRLNVASSASVTLHSIEEIAVS